MSTSGQGSIFCPKNRKDWNMWRSITKWCALRSTQGRLVGGSMVTWTCDFNDSWASKMMEVHCLDRKTWSQFIHGIAIWTCKYGHVQWNFKESLLETQWSHLQPAHQATIRTSKLWGQMSRMGFGTLGGGTKESCPIYGIYNIYMSKLIFQRFTGKKT